MGCDAWLWWPPRSPPRPLIPIRDTEADPMTNLNTVRARFAQSPGLPFVFEDESLPSSSFDELIQRYGRTHEQQSAWLAAATEPDLARVLESALIPGGKCSVAQALMQVCMHSHGHRAQCAKLLRRHGGVPPMTDFILWLETRPTAEWAVPLLSKSIVTP